MGLGSCPDCGGKLSTSAKTCPHCGRPCALQNEPDLKIKKANTSATRKGCLFVFGVLALSVFVILCNVNSDNTDSSLFSAENRHTSIEELDKKARAIPSSNAKANLDAYQELLQLVPSSERYKNKVAHYESILAEQGIRTSSRKPTQAHPTFSVVSNEVYDVPLKTQVERKIVISEKCSSEEIEKFLRNQYDVVRDMDGFQYHSHPTHVWVAAYHSLETAEGAPSRMLGRISAYGSDKSADLTLDKDLIAVAWNESESRFSLTTETRKAIYLKLSAIEEDVMKRADAKIPIIDTESLKRNSELQSRLTNELEAEILDEHEISKEDLNSIFLEGWEKGWPDQSE